MLEGREEGLSELQSLLRCFTCAVFPLLNRRKLCLGDQVTLGGPRAEGVGGIGREGGSHSKKGVELGFKPRYFSASTWLLCYPAPLGTKGVCVCVCAHVPAAGAANKLARTQEGSPKARGTRRGGGQAPTRQAPTRGTPPPPPPPCKRCPGSRVGGSRADCVGVLCPDGTPQSSPPQPAWAPLTPAPLTFKVREVVTLVHSGVTWPPWAPFPSCKMGTSLLPRPLPGRKR